MIDAECFTCSELEGHRVLCDPPDWVNDATCESAKRDCGHHCNHLWDQDACCWCGKEIEYDEQ